MNLNLHGGKRELKSTASYQVQAVTGGIRKVSKYIRYLLTWSKFKLEVNFAGEKSTGSYSIRTCLSVHRGKSSCICFSDFKIIVCHEIRVPKPEILYTNWDWFVLITYVWNYQLCNVYFQFVLGASCWRNDRLLFSLWVHYK